MSRTNEQVQGEIKALLEERRGYELAGKTDRAKQVDERLRELGHKGSAPAKRAATRKA